MNTYSILAGARTFLSALMSTQWLEADGRTSALLPALCLLSSVLCPLSSAVAGTFSGNAGVGIADSTGGLSWNHTTNALTVQCWFKFSSPLERQPVGQHDHPG